MKTSKIWSILVVLMVAFCATMTMTSCGSDDVEGSLVGKWEYSLSKGNASVYVKLNLKDNKQAESQAKITAAGATIMNLEASGTWTNDDNYIYLTDSNGVVDKIKYSLNGDKLTLYNFADIDGYDVMVLER
ncbi:MAG: hypothetical protein KBT34_08585 [Prevotella sp.]|nr:hypothetical protein [Candidatus Prevotella equi]